MSKQSLGSAAAGRQAAHGERAGESFDAALAARACRRYFLDDRTKQEIAAELGISRFKVARLLREARARGVVRIEVLDPGELDARRRLALHERWGLRHAVVVAPDEPGELLPALGAGAARLLRRALRPGDVLGIAWGSTLEAAVSALEAEGGPAPVDVVQLAGGFQGVEPAYNAIELAGRAARVLGGRLHPLHAPALLSTAETRSRLLREPSVAATVRRFGQVTVALVGIGALRPRPTSALYQGGVLSPAMLRELRRHGAVGDAFCQFLDEDGRVLAEFGDRIVAMEVERIRAVPLRIGVAGGAGKLVAIRAALRGGLVNALVTDAATAEALLQPDH
jgi:DNA-binding transcriptional regulator LsrR (DeoR family)